MLMIVTLLTDILHKQNIHFYTENINPKSYGNSLPYTVNHFQEHFIFPLQLLSWLSVSSLFLLCVCVGSSVLTLSLYGERFFILKYRYLLISALLFVFMSRAHNKNRCKHLALHWSMTWLALWALKPLYSCLFLS